MKALSVLILFFVASGAIAQCPAGVCPLPYSVPYMQPPAELPRWFLADDGRFDLWHRGQYLGALDPETLEWQADGKKSPTDLRKAFGMKLKKAIEKKTQPPGEAASSLSTCSADCACGPLCPGEGCACGEESPAPPSFAQNFGMEWKSKGNEKCKINGVETTHQRLIEALTGGAMDIPDDSAVPRLLVLSRDPALRSRVLSDLQALINWRDKVIAQAYDPSGPEAWAVKALYPKEGLYYVDADGKTRGYSPDYSDGPQGLALALGEAQKLREPTPGVDPSKAPDLAKPKPPTPDVKPSPNSPTPSDPAAPAAGSPQPYKPIDMIVGGIILAGLAGLGGAALMKRK